MSCAAAAGVPGVFSAANPGREASTIVALTIGATSAAVVAGALFFGRGAAGFLAFSGSGVAATTARRVAVVVAAFRVAVVVAAFRVAVVVAFRVPVVAAFARAGAARIVPVVAFLFFG
jgi:hypothetical protein